ncbi:MAG: MarR family transcriptional regulator [Johnsonella sp.]|nr:MarR family transcriptional regulator [Johnsonella sp.]
MPLWKGRAVDRYSILNDILVKLFNEIMDIQEEAIITSEFKDITNNDMHVIEAIGMGEQKNMSALAAALSITMGSLTISINSLVKKGYVKRRRSQKDRRVVNVELSKTGIAAYEHHRRFHREMVEAMTADLSDQEIEAIITSLKKIDEWLLEKRKENKEI